MTPGKISFNRWRSLLICLFLTASTLSVYLQTVNFDFINLDDGQYISKTVLQGLTLENIIWSTTAKVAANWHPLTMISHMLDCQLYGLNSGLHHLTSIFFHIANTLLLFFVLKRLTGVLWQSAFVAALFALHPLHVESVAWVAERKDVLSTFFWMLTMWAYVRFVERPGVKRYLPVLAFFILGLMAKPMLVTLPFVLLLLDYWPLKRFQFEHQSTQSIATQKVSFSHLVYEKIPLFVLSTASCIITFSYQGSLGAMSSISNYPLNQRFANAFVSYIDYLIKTICPFNLAVYYPHTGILPIWKVSGAITLLALITVLAFRFIKRHPYLVVGWLWYIGTLVPVIGLVQVGGQTMADRYTYIPLIGIFIIIAWGVSELLVKWSYKTKFLTALSLAVVLVLIPVSWTQVRYWKNSISLFEHALDVTKGNYLAHTIMALELTKQGRIDRAIKHSKEALKIYPGYILAANNLGELLVKQNKIDEAIKYYSMGLKNSMSLPAYAMTYSLAHHSLGALLARQNKIDEAIKHFSKSLKIDPASVTTHMALGAALATQGNNKKAIEHFNAGLNDITKAHLMLGDLLLVKGEVNEAVANFQEALRINFNFAEGHTHLGYALFIQGREDEAIKHCLEAIRIAPEKSVNAYYNLACIYASRNEINESIVWLKNAIDRGFNNWEMVRTDKDLENIRNTSYYIEITNRTNSATKALRHEGENE